MCTLYQKNPNKWAPNQVVRRPSDLGTTDGNLKGDLAGRHSTNYCKTYNSIQFSSTLKCKNNRIQIRFTRG